MKNTHLLTISGQPCQTEFLSKLLEGHGFQVIGIDQTVDGTTYRLTKTDEKANTQPQHKIPSNEAVFSTSKQDFKQAFLYVNVKEAAPKPPNPLSTNQPTNGDKVVAKQSKTAPNPSQTQQPPLSKGEEMPKVKYHGVIFVKNEHRYEKLLVEDIRWVEAQGAYCQINTKQKRLLLSVNLSTFQKLVKAPPYLVRVHRSFIVNTYGIDAFENNYLHIDGKAIPLGGKYKSAFLNVFPFIDKHGVII